MKKVRANCCGLFQRLDECLVERGLCETRSKARALILAGQVLVNGAPLTKAGDKVAVDAKVELAAVNPFVSRGGLKLQGALEHFGAALGLEGKADLVALDVGASTGGFTDCLLKRGFIRVHAVDVGYGQLDYKLRNDARVRVHEKVNIRYLEPAALGEKVDLIVIDVSFISILKFLERLPQFLKSDGRILAMVKPQFEAGKGEVGKGGVLRDAAKINAIVERFLIGAQAAGFECLGRVASEVRGAKGNQEYFCLLAPLRTSAG